MSSSTKFNPGDYLKGLGWKGEGTGLHEGSRAKPITVAKKTSLSGLGKDRDVAFPWWEMVFKNVAGKVGAGATATTSTDQPNDLHHRTTTGIISPLPPRPKPDQYTPASSSSSGGGINLDAFAAAKIEQARRQLYAGFLRGKIVGGTAEEAIKREAEELAATVVGEGQDQGEMKKKRTKKSGKSEAALEGKRIRKAIRAKRRELRAATTSATTSGVVTPIDTTEEEDHSNLGDPSTSTSTSTCTSPPPPPPPTKKRTRSPSLSTTKIKSKKSRSSSKSSSLSTSELNSNTIEDDEEDDVTKARNKAARKAAKVAAKEEKMLRKVVRRALREENGQE